MASGASTGGKVLTGCSCLSIMIFFILSAFTAFGLEVAMQELPNLNELWYILAGPASWGFNACCCLSGVGLIVGVALIMVGRKSEGAEG